LNTICLVVRPNRTRCSHLRTRRPCSRTLIKRRQVPQTKCQSRRRAATRFWLLELVAKRASVAVSKLYLFFVNTNVRCSLNDADQKWISLLFGRREGTGLVELELGEFELLWLNKTSSLLPIDLFNDFSVFLIWTPRFFKFSSPTIDIWLRLDSARSVWSILRLDWNSCVFFFRIFLWRCLLFWRLDYFKIALYLINIDFV
jgi:hypothetical protein